MKSTARGHKNCSKMSTINSTGERPQKTFEQLFCAAKFTQGIQSQLIVFSAVNMFFSITAFLGNSLILVALHKKTSLHPPSKLLYRNLAITDVCVGIIAQPLLVIWCMSVINERWNSCVYALYGALTTGFTLCAVSLLTMTAVSVDRLLALLLGFRYRYVVTSRRTCLTIVVFWVLSLVGALTHFQNFVITYWYSYIIIALGLTVSSASHVTIFITLRKHQIQVQDRVHLQRASQAIPLNIARYKKAVSSALWVQAALVICYLPHGVVDALRTQLAQSTSDIIVVRRYTLTLLYFNSTLNPILYCWKINEVRQAVKETIRNCWRSSTS